jgi:hypothetical protein
MAGVVTQINPFSKGCTTSFNRFNASYTHKPNLEMLHIKNIKKLIDKPVFGGWVIKEVHNHPTVGFYIFDIQCFSPIGVSMDMCTISLTRKGVIFRNTGEPPRLTYFFRYNGKETNVCAGRDWLCDMDNFIGQFEYIIKKYHLLT